MKTENLKKEEIFLNLAKCSEEERKEVYKLTSVIYDGFQNYLHYNFSVPKNKNCWFSFKIWNNGINKTEVNFQEFKEIMWATFEDEKVEIFDIDFGGNCMARMEIQNGKFKFTNAMNGGGYPIAIEDIKITPTKK